MIYSILGLAVLILDIIAIVDVVKSSKDAGGKVLWVLLILILPVLGMILYFAVGRQ